MSTRRTAISLFVAAAFLALAGTGLAQNVGVTGAVNPNTTGLPPGGTVRVLGAGNDVVYNERIATEATGQAEILFLDRSSLTIGPNSELVIDEFVYSPETGTGKLAASATKGVFRFVGGALSKNPDSVTIKTPAAIVGIRGGVGIGQIEPNGATSFYFLFGENASLTAGGTTKTLHRRGWFLTALPGGGITDAQPADAAKLQGLLKLLTGTPGGNGGAKPQPTEQGMGGAGGLPVSPDDDLDSNQIDLRNYLRPVDQFDIFQIEKLYKGREPHPVIIICRGDC
jgi:trimeric autotransporter adhesin